jgi:hypothetical protein
MGRVNVRNDQMRVKRNAHSSSNRHANYVRAADAKEVGVGNPAEETYCHPDEFTLFHPPAVCQLVIGVVAVLQSVWQLTTAGAQPQL